MKYWAVWTGMFISGLYKTCIYEWCVWCPTVTVIAACISLVVSGSNAFCQHVRWLCGHQIRQVSVGRILWLPLSQCNHRCQRELDVSKLWNLFCNSCKIHQV